MTSKYSFITISLLLSSTSCISETHIMRLATQCIAMLRIRKALHTKIHRKFPTPIIPHQSRLITLRLLLGFNNTPLVPQKLGSCPLKRSSCTLPSLLLRPQSPAGPAYPVFSALGPLAISKLPAAAPWLLPSVAGGRSLLILPPDEDVMVPCFSLFARVCTIAAWFFQI